MFAEGNEAENQLIALQPYINELQAINQELGSDMQICISTPEEIASSYEEFSAMTVSEFRDYIIKTYNENYLNYEELIVPNEFNAEISSSPSNTMRASLYNLEQKIWQLGGNFYNIESQYFYGDGKARYYKITEWTECIFSYPAYRTTGISAKIEGDQTSATVSIYYYHYLTENLLLASNELKATATIYANGADAYLPGHFQDI